MFGISKIGKLFGAGDSQSKYNREELQNALDEYKRLYQPTVGQLGAGPIKSSYGKEDPRLKRYQMSAIEDLRNLYSQGGLDANARARLDEIRRREDTQARGAREAITQNARARGVGGGSLVDQLINAQSSADRRSAADTQVSADAENRAMRALLDSANLSGDVRGQDFQKMSALDAIKRFNAQNRADAYQQRFQNQYGVAGQKSGLYTKMGEAAAKGEDQNFGFGTGVLGGVGKLVGKSGVLKKLPGYFGKAFGSVNYGSGGGWDNGGAVYSDDNMPAPGQSAGDWQY